MLALGLLLLLVEGVLLAAATVGVGISSTGAIQPYSNVPTSRPSSDAILAAMEQLTSPSEVSNYQRLKAILGASNLQSQDPVAAYLRALSNFSSNLQQITVNLQLAKASLASGDTQAATAYANGLIVLRQKASTLLQDMRTQLVLIHIQQEATPLQVQSIGERIDELQRLYVEYSIAIDSLRSEITSRTVLLTVAVSQSTIFVDEPLEVQGHLQSRNGTILAGRNVTITWALNKTNVLTTSNGTFEASIAFQRGASSGIALVTAIFQPNVSDAATYALTIAEAPVDVAYYPTRIVATLAPATVLPLDQVTVTGNLTAATGLPLENRTLGIQLDNDFLGNTTTENGGAFLFTFRTPANVPNGNHTLEVLYNPIAEIFAPTNASSTLSVQRETIQIETKSSSSALSGLVLTMTGTVSFNSTVSPQDTLEGTATIALDGKPYATSAIGSDGKFTLGFTVPLDVSLGQHSITLEYVPVDPRVDSSTRALQLYVYNSIIIAVTGATAVLAPSSFLLERRRRKLRLARQAMITPLEPSLLEEEAPPFTPTDWEVGLREAEAETSASRKVILCYRLARKLVASQLNYRVSNSETHWEFYRNVVVFKPELETALERITQLFELAEYSAFETPVADADETKRLLLKLQDAN